MLRPALVIAALSLASAATAEGLCPLWSDPETIGALDVGAIPEASGLAISRDGSRYYVINDGSRPWFFVIDPDGGAMQRVTVTGFAPRDIEDIALGPCVGGTCLYLADIGDNGSRRANVGIAIVEEAERFGSEVAAQRIVTARYPDGPHDAEAIAMLPSGDLLLVTKSRLGRNEPARAYRLSADRLAAGGTQTFEHLGEIPISSLIPVGLNRRVVTAMDITPDGSRLLLLTYDAALEVALDADEPFPAPNAWVEGQTHRAIPIAFMIQAESIAYADNGRAFVYTTESVRRAPAPIMRQACR
jgi:hypothetical protein